MSKGILSDGSGNLTGITISYLTGEMYGSRTYDVGLGFTNGNDKLLNGYLDRDPGGALGTNVITFTNLSPAIHTPSSLTRCGTQLVLRLPIGSMKTTPRPS